MLTALDDSPWHQIPSTFDHVGTSDPRFFDRLWFAAYDPANRRAIQLTLGFYQNMNVVDGGFVVIDDNTQYNLRVSRSLRPEYETRCGPLELDVLKPMRLIHIGIEPHDGQVFGQLSWTSELAAQEEAHHFNRVNGRVVEDYRRYDQIGSLSGWLDIGGTRCEVDSWWACRDHSWGVRANVGIPEPFTGLRATPSGFAFAFLFFSTEEFGGHVQLSRLDYSSDVTVEIIEKATDTCLVADKLAIDATFVDAHRPRRFDRVRFDVTTDAGELIAIDVAAVGPSVAMQGLGYGGYDDGLGLGVYRGDEHTEVDRYDVADPAEVVMPDGTVTRPLHRIQPVAITLHARGRTGHGTGGLTFIAETDLDADGHLRVTNEPNSHPSRT